MLRRPLTSILSTPSPSTRCGFPHASTVRHYAAQLPPRLVIKEDEIEESFLKGSGPGGQKINKTSSAVQLKHLPTGMVVKSQATRSRSQNRSIARRLLADKLEEAEKGPESRTALKDEIKRKKKASKSKKARRKHRTQEDNEDDEKAGRQHEGALTNKRLTTDRLF
ncbi:MAG: hypothetical protein LQ352_001033 [Teloschistes flavicans]|nr:MAG: hypothetical protein LQ352_001033 [Teloschistes flavicans]